MSNALEIEGHNTYFFISDFLGYANELIDMSPEFQEKLPDLLTLKYQEIRDAEEILGGVENIRTAFIDFQKYLYEEVVA